jgi:hypothetical protein
MGSVVTVNQWYPSVQLSGLQFLNHQAQGNGWDRQCTFDLNILFNLFQYSLMFELGSRLLPFIEKLLQNDLCLLAFRSNVIR